MIYDHRYVQILFLILRGLSIHVGILCTDYVSIIGVLNTYSVLRKTFIKFN